MRETLFLKLRMCRWRLRAAILAAMLQSAAFAVNPSINLPNLQITPVVTGLTQPTGIAFIGANDFFVLEKASGQVKRVVNGQVTAVVLDLPVNSNSERGLLGIALHPNFPTDPSVYLYWTESSTGADSTVVTEVGNPASTYQPGTPAPLGNRVDRFVWNPQSQTLTYAGNIIRLHAFQHDNNNPTSTNPTAAFAGNHNCGKIAFGPDGKLYIMIGDNGRRGWLQNLPGGAFIPSAPDDEFGGPEPDNNHVTGSIFRLNSDGSTPLDNPFFTAGSTIGGEVGANIQKIFSYGHRNGFGLAFDPISGRLWDSENGDDSFDEINQVSAGGNYGWVQLMGPLSRIAEFKAIEMNLFTAPAVIGTLQQIRYPTSRIAYTGALALSRMFMLPGAVYHDPEISWRYSIPPSGLGFVKGDGLGSNYSGTLWSGQATPGSVTGAATGTFAGGVLMMFRLTADRAHLDLSADPRLADRVVDNGIAFPPAVGTPAATAGYKLDGTESESLLVGQNFGVLTDIQTGPDGNLYLTSNTDNTVYRISRIQ